jgi:hypothetical protein
MRRIALLGLVWTALVLAVVFFAGGVVQTPGCMQKITLSPECSALAAQMADRAWWAHDLPILAICATGYVVVALLALRHIRHARRNRG